MIKPAAPVHFARHDLTEHRLSEDMSNAIALVHHFSDRDAVHDAGVMGLTTGSGIKERPVEVYPLAGFGEIDDPGIERAGISILVVESVRFHASDVASRTAVAASD